MMEIYFHVQSLCWTVLLLDDRTSKAMDPVRPPAEREKVNPQVGPSTLSLE
jgi:hypothetical protein